MKTLLHALVVALGATAAHAKLIAVHTDAAPPGPGDAAQGIIDPRGYLVTSMQYGLDPKTGELASGGASAQMTQAMTNIAAVFTAAGQDLATSGASCWLYGVNATTFGPISNAYNTFFPDKAHHPSRNPTGATLVLDGALVGVSCRGFPDGGVRIVPPIFFPSDFNAQGLLVDGGAHLYTSAQVGADPVAGKLVTGGAVNETRQAMSNIAVVFATAFPHLGRSALAKRASECQLLVVNDTASGAESVWPAVESEYASFFPPGAAPAASITGFPAGSLPIPASVAVTCNGVGSRAKRTVLSRGRGVVAHVGETTYLQASAQLGSDVSATFAATGAVFAEVFTSSMPSWLKASIMPAVATECQLWLADPAADVKSALAVLSQLFLEGRGAQAVMPALTVTKAALPSGKGVALQCFGSHTVN